MSRVIRFPLSSSRISPGEGLGADLSVPAEDGVDLGQVGLAALAHGKGQAALTDGPVALALLGDGIALVLPHGQVLGLHQLRQGFGEVEIGHPLVAEGQLRQGGEVHRPCQACGDIED